MLSLPRELREEVLIGSPDEFILSLPQDLQTEARNLRDNIFMRNWNYQNEEQEAEEVNNNNITSAPSCIKKFIKKNKLRLEFEAIYNKDVSMITNNEKTLID